MAALGNIATNISQYGPKNVLKLNCGSVLSQTAIFTPQGRSWASKSFEDVSQILSHWPELLSQTQNFESRKNKQRSGLEALARLRPTLKKYRLAAPLLPNCPTSDQFSVEASAIKIRDFTNDTLLIIIAVWSPSIFPVTNFKKTAKDCFSPCASD